jgi:glycosyltransferase involved in cell wall biosynthesis
MQAAPPSWNDLHARFSDAGAAFAFVIPVYNHARNIEQVVQAALQSGAPVVVVDDGSTDETRDKVARLSGVTVVRHSENRGKGAAILTGLATAAAAPIQAHFVVTVDGDGQHTPDDARHLLAGLWGQDPGDSAGTRRLQTCFVLGNRSGMDQAHVPWTSRAGRRFSGFWIWASGGPVLADSQSGLRVYPVVETLALPTRARRFEFEVEVLVHARRAGIPVREVPVTVAYDPPGGRVSHFRPWRDFGRNSAVFTRLIVGRVLASLSRRRRLGKDGAHGA